MKKSIGKNLFMFTTSGTTILFASLYGVSQTSKPEPMVQDIEEVKNENPVPVLNDSPEQTNVNSAYATLAKQYNKVVVEFERLKPENAELMEQFNNKVEEINLLKKKYSNNDLIVEELKRQIESLITKINDLKKQLKDTAVELQMEKNWSEQLESDIEKLEDYITKLDEWAESLHDMFTNFTKL